MLRTILDAYDLECNAARNVGYSSAYDIETNKTPLGSNKDAIVIRIHDLAIHLKSLL
jgi:hypothetical protein